MRIRKMKKTLILILSICFATTLMMAGIAKAQEEKININTATSEELQKLQGIGPAKAEAIIKYREENGKFAKIEDIKNVSGIGDAIFEDIKDSITVGEEETPKEE